MKVVHDFSVTSAQHGVGKVAPIWDLAWSSPASAQRPELVLDFAADTYGAGHVQSPIGNIVSLNRASTASVFDLAGTLQTAAPDQHRLTHDPSTFARLGLLLEPAGQNLMINTDNPITQIVSVTGSSLVLSFFGTGTVVLSGAHSATVSGLGAFPSRTELVFTPSAGALTIDVSGSVSNIQLESGTYPSSYVASLATPGDRAADIATVALGNWFDQTGGTIVFSGHLDGALANDRILELDAGSTATRLSLLWNTVLNKPQFQVWNSGSLQAAIAPGGNAVSMGTPFRVAMGFAKDDFAVSLNGSPTANDTLGTLPGGLDTLRLGRSIWGAQSALTAESLVYYPSRLSDGELQMLSA